MVSKKNRNVTYAINNNSCICSLHIQYKSVFLILHLGDLWSCVCYRGCDK